MDILLNLAGWIAAAAIWVFLPFAWRRLWLDYRTDIGGTRITSVRNIQIEQLA